MELKRCPLCDCANHPAEARCRRCSHVFDQDPGTALAVVREHRSHMWILLGAMIMVDVLLAICAVHAGLAGAIPLGLSLLFTAHTGRSLSITRASVRQLEGGRLPRAVLRKGLPSGEPPSD
jgi:hypothetical protein